MHIRVTHLTGTVFGFEVQAGDCPPRRVRVEYPFSVVGPRGLFSAALAAVSPKVFLLPYLERARFFLDDRPVSFDSVAEAAAAAGAVLLVLKSVRRAMTWRQLLSPKGIAQLTAEIVKDHALVHVLKKLQ